MKKVDHAWQAFSGEPDVWVHACRPSQRKRSGLVSLNVCTTKMSSRNLLYNRDGGTPRIRRPPGLPETGWQPVAPEGVPMARCSRVNEYREPATSQSLTWFGGGPSLVRQSSEVHILPAKDVKRSLITLHGFGGDYILNWYIHISKCTRASMTDQNNEGRQVEDELPIDDLDLTEEELRELQADDYCLEDIPDEGRDENQAANEMAVRGMAVHGAMESPAPDVVQGMGSAQNITNFEVNNRSEGQRVRDPADPGHDILRDVLMPDAHDLEDNEYPQADRENSRVTTPSVSARLTGERPRSRATVPGVQTGQMSPIFRSPKIGPVNMARRTPIVVRPETSRFTASEDTDAQKVASWRVRGLTPLRLSPEHMEDITYLRECHIEFALLSNGQYIPEGIRINDLMRLYVARNYTWLSSNNMMQRIVAAEVLKLKGELKELIKEVVKLRTENMENAESKIQEMQEDLRDMRSRLAAYDAEYEEQEYSEQPEPGELAGPGKAAEEDRQATAAASAPPSPEVGKLNYMSKMALFGDHTAHPFRSWQEWEEEFMQKAALIRLNEDNYYGAALVQLSQPLREAWVAYIRENPSKANWQGMQDHMQSQYAPLDRSAEAEKRFKGQKMVHESEKALQAYCAIQIRNITEMGPESSFSSKGMWDQFLSGLPEPLLRTAASIYASEKSAYDAPSPISRMPQLRAQRASQQNSVASSSQRSTGTKRGSDQSVRQGSSQPAPKLARFDRSIHRRQPLSYAQYYSVPNNMTAEDCPDVGYQSEGQVKPFSQSLREQLINENKCLSCWQEGHGITTCPNLPAEVAQEMERSRARYTPATAPSRYLDVRHEVTDAGQTPGSIPKMNAESNSEQYITPAGGFHTGVVAEGATRQEAGDSSGQNTLQGWQDWPPGQGPTEGLLRIQG